MEALTKFHQELVAIYGYGLQVSTALPLWNKWLAELVSSTPSTRGEILSLGSFNPSEIDADAPYDYQRTFGYLLNASEEDGETLLLHRKYLMILLYAAWEDRYRQEIAREAGLNSRNCLTSDVFEDVRAYRHAIVHANGKLQSEPKVFRFFNKGQELYLTRDHMDVIFTAAGDECNKIGRRFFGTDPSFRFSEPLDIV